jgi:hypothetical protein
LQSACTSGDAETRGRATDLLKRIGHRALVARILKPTTVTLDFDNTPLIEAVATLAKQTGLVIDPYGFPGYRKVTVKSGPLPAWEAVELFCRKADLHEWDRSVPAPAGAPQTTQVVGPGNIVLGGVQGQVIVNGRATRATPTIPSDRVALLNGPGGNWPTCHSGALRLRLLPAGTLFPIVDADATLLPLHVSAEPHTQFGGVLGVKIDKAVDDNGTPLQSSGVIAPFANNEQMVFVAMPNGAMRAQPVSSRTGLAAVRIVRADHAAKSLRLISGELSAQVHVVESLARIDAPIKAGANAGGSSSVELKVIEINAPSAGELKMTVELTMPPDVQAAGGPAGNPGRVVAQGGIVFQQQVVFSANGDPPALPAGKTEFVGLAIEDAKGAHWWATHGQQESMRFGPDGLTMRLAVNFKAPAADAAAARLVFRGSRPVVIAIPFTFRDVPLR